MNSSNLSNTLKPEKIIAHCYPGISLHNKISTKGLMYCDIKCRMNYPELWAKYSTKKERGEGEVMRRKVEKIRKSLRQTN